HRCLCGMGTPDMLGTYGTYQHFAEDGPAETRDEGGGKRSRLVFENDTARASIIGPEDSNLREPRPMTVEFLVHRDRQANPAVIEIQGRRILLRQGDWGRWTRLSFLPTWSLSSASAICRFYLQQVAPNFRLYVSPINFDPSAPATQISEPGSFVQAISEQLGL